MILTNRLKSRKGVALLLTMVVLVLLASIGYSLTSMTSLRKSRQQYLIDYSKASYACDSAMKIALDYANSIAPRLIVREGAPDFSDLFAMDRTKEELLKKEFVTRLQQAIVTESDFESSSDRNSNDDEPTLLEMPFMEYIKYEYDEYGNIDLETVNVPGPYGYEWPLISDPQVIEFGDARITIEIHDENAKLPIAFGFIDDPKIEYEREACIRTYCEWVAMTSEQYLILNEQLNKIVDVKPFTFNPKRVVITEKVTTQNASASQPVKKTTGADDTKKTAKTTTSTRVKRTARDAIAHRTDWARLTRANLDLMMFSAPYYEGKDRKESAKKYLGLWGSSDVNINTAPRHVLEAVFMFGGEAVEISEQIIQERMIEPFKSTEDIKNRLTGFSDVIDKMEKYITTKSSIFSIKVTATSGKATLTSEAAVMLNKGRLEKIAVVSQY